MAATSQSHAQLAYDKLLDMISAGRIKPGERLPTVPLAEEFGVSRTPVMEALKRMENEGIVVFKSGNGAWVIDPTKEEINDLYFARGHLEALALELSFAAITTPAVIGLRKHIELEREYFKLGEKVNYLRVGLDFHRDLARCCPNHYLVSYIMSAIAATYAYLLLFQPAGYIAGERHPEEHQILLDFIGEGDLKKAKRYLLRHVVGAFDSYLARSD